MINNPENTFEKRTLKKIRRPFLDHNISEAETEASADEASSQSNLEHKNVKVLQKCIGVVEIDGKIQVSMGFLSPYLEISDLRIEEVSPFKVVTMNLNFHTEVKIQWEDTVQRLLASQDPEQLMWANKILHYHQNRPQMIEEYLQLVNSDDNKNLAEVRKAKTRAVLACREIESKFAYAKIVTFSGRESVELLSISFSEGFLKVLGFEALEEFIEYSKTKGLPQVYEGDLPAHLQLAKDILDFKIFGKNETVTIGPEYHPLIEDKDGNKKQVTGQYRYVLDPTSHGFFLSGYFIFKNFGLDQETTDFKNKDAMEEEHVPSDPIKEENKEF